MRHALIVQVLPRRNEGHRTDGAVGGRHSGRVIAVGPESTSSNLGNWATHPGANIISNQRPQATPDVETLTFSIPLSQSKEFFRFTFTP